MAGKGDEVMSYRDAVTKLHLEPGDVLLIDPEKINVMDILDAQVTIPFSVPIIVARNGAITKVSKEDAITVLKEIANG